eukprot:scpid82428/ scgid33106/ 
MALAGTYHVGASSVLRDGKSPCGGDWTGDDTDRLAARHGGSSARQRARYQRSAASLDECLTMSAGCPGPDSSELGSLQLPAGHPGVGPRPCSSAPFGQYQQQQQYRHQSPHPHLRLLSDAVSTDTRLPRGTMLGMFDDDDSNDLAGVANDVVSSTMANSASASASATATSRRRKGGHVGALTNAMQQLELPRRRIGRTKAPSPLTLNQQPGPSRGQQQQQQRWHMGRTSSECELLQFTAGRHECAARVPKTSTDSTSSVDSTDSVGMVF